MPERLVHTGRKIRVFIDEKPQPDGSVIRRDVIRHPGAVVILPVLDVNHVVLLRNERFVVGETLWECPAGTLEPNEELQVAAARELAEETGYTAGRWRYLGFLYASPGVLDEKLHLFIAEDLVPGVARPEPEEKLQPIVLEHKTALHMALDGSIRDAKTITSLLLWDRLRLTDHLERGLLSHQGHVTG